jgi:hypothetical protein
MAETPSRSTTDPGPTVEAAATEATSRSSERPGGPEEDPLLVWALASFHAALVLVVPLTAAHAVAPSGVGGLLAGLDTLVGVALYLVLWGSTWWSNRRYLAASEFDDLRGTLRAGAKWGAVTGLPLFLCVVVAALLVTTPVFAALLLVVGGLVALLVGGVVGATLAGVDVALDRLAEALAS